MSKKKWRLTKIRVSRRNEDWIEIKFREKIKIEKK